VSVARLSGRPFPRRRASLGAALALVRALGLGSIGLGLLAVVLGFVIAGPFVAPQSPLDFVAGPFQSPDAEHWLGTDILGRDALSRVLWGGYEMVGLSAAATLIGVLLGAVLGIGAGYLKGPVDELIMRVLDVALAFPQTILALLFISLIGPQLWLVTLIVATTHAPQVARVARAATLRVVEEDFVRYSEALGMSGWGIMRRDLLPNIATPILVELGLRLPYSISLIAGLSFLGFGAQPPAPDWGLMINENRIGLAENPWPVIAPVLLIAIATIGVNLFTDAIGRNSLHPARTAPDDRPEAPTAALPPRLPRGLPS
jgi:peptide/nickel transport system permease protein